MVRSPGLQNNIMKWICLLGLAWAFYPSQLLVRRAGTTDSYVQLNDSPEMNGRQFKPMDKLLLQEKLEIIRIYSPVGGGPIKVGGRQCAIPLVETVKPKALLKRLIAIFKKMRQGEYPHLIGLHLIHNGNSIQFSILTSQESSKRTMAISSIDSSQIV